MSEIYYTTLSHPLCQPVADLLEICFPDMPPEYIYNAEELADLAELYPEGTIVALHRHRVIGMGAGVLLNIDFDNMPPTENELLYDMETDEERHDVTGDYYYGSEMAVHPDYRGHGIARQIYNRRKQEVISRNKKGFVAAAVIPGYAEHRDLLSIHEYVEAVVAGDFFDPTLSVQLRNGFHVVKLIKDFYVFPRSDNWCALILWENWS